MGTTGQLARLCGLSRTALLYYERIGLMPSPLRTEGNYRVYDSAALERLRAICAYRDAGLALEDIRALLDHPASDAGAVLERRLCEIDAEIAALRAHQQALARLLGHHMLRKGEMINKEKWVEIMRSSGFSDEQMWAWHSEFECAAPKEHQEFLEFLHIEPDEIATIRARSRKG